METSVVWQTGKVSKHLKRSKERYLIGQNLQVSGVIPFIKLQTQPANFGVIPFIKLQTQPANFGVIPFIKLQNDTNLLGKCL